MARRFDLDEAALRVDGVVVDRARPIAWYADLLGEVPRTEVPEIARRRPDLSNKLHIFDAAGIVANEHHAHKLVFSVTFALVPEETAFPPRHAFNGELHVYGARLFGRESEHQIAARGLPAADVFVHNWCYDTPTFAIHLTFCRLRDARWGKRTGVHRLTEVDFGIFTPEHLALHARERGEGP
jgi:hypothetical protein